MQRKKKNPKNKQTKKPNNNNKKHLKIFLPKGKDSETLFT